jgi:uncharacterized protein
MDTLEKDYIRKIDENAERRFFDPKMEVRSEGESRMIEGVAAVVGKTTNMGWYDEEIARGAFDDVLGDDVVALFNHDPNLPLARSTAKGDGKLEIFIGNQGDLMYRFKAPNTSIGNDLLENIKNEVINKSSFAFRIKEEDWIFGDEGKKVNDKRIIKKMERLYDVSPVTSPAYADTSVAARSKDVSKPEPNNIKERKEFFKRKYNK